MFTDKIAYIVWQDAINACRSCNLGLDKGRTLLDLLTGRRLATEQHENREIQLFPEASSLLRRAETHLYCFSLLRMIFYSAPLLTAQVCLSMLISESCLDA